jgi:dephospho-CoA kinase
MFILGLTGSIGMGKSTTAGFFREAGVPVLDSDAVVHRLYAGEAVAPVEAAFPGSTVDGRIDRGKLSEQLIGNPDAIKRLEAIVHPLVRAVTLRFIADHAARGTRVIVLDVPLLFETGGESKVDAVVVVSAPADVQRARVLKRPGMTA